VNLSAAEIALFVAVFFASGVEMVEAFTIVLAMGLTRGWRSALAGTGIALVVLTIITAIVGISITTWFPEALLQLLVGTLLLVFGLQWLIKAVQRATGLKAQHDELAIFAAQEAAAREASASQPVMFGLDPFGLFVSFKGVLLEGLEVVFIVLTFGVTAHNMGLAAIAAVAAGVIVLTAGLLVHKPLSRVPENTIKYGVGLLLTTFGTFWAVEGLGVFSASRESFDWPLGDYFLVVVLVGWFIVTRAAIAVLRRRVPGAPIAPPASVSSAGEA
jgi:uncharacterized membrane protein